VLGRLVEAGILRAEDQQFLWVFSRRAYPQRSGREEREAKARLMSLIFDNAIPTPRDTLLFSLADSAGVLNEILSSKEMSKASKRIAEIVALEEIGRSVRAIVANRRMALAAAASGRSWVGPGRDW
jgi:Golgi phosphoprotein 3